MKSNGDSINPDVVHQFKQSEEKIITEKLLLETIERASKIDKNNRTITFAASGNGSAIDINIINENKDKKPVDLSKIKNLQDLKDQGISLEINRGINKSYEAVYNKDESIIENLIPIKLEANVAKNLNRRNTENIDKSIIENYKYHGSKSGGANSPGELGGVYKLGEDTYLIKQDTRSGKIRSNKVIAEYVANKVFNDMYPNMGPEISLVKSDTKQGDEAIYLGVKYFKNYRDMYQDVADVLGKKIPEARFEPFSSDMSSGIRKATQEGNEYKNINHLISGSLLLNDFSVHSGNIGVVNKNGTKHAVRIDFGSALNKMTSEVEYDKKISNKFGFNKNYFERDYDNDIKLTKEFADALYKSAEKDVINPFKHAIQECEQQFSFDALKKFALDSKFIKREEIDGIGDKSALTNKINENAEKIFDSRKQSLKNYASSIELEVFVRDSDKENKPIDKNDLKKIIDKNKDYFVDLCVGFKEVKIIDKSNKLTSETKNEINNILKNEIESKKNFLKSGVKEITGKYFENKKDNELDSKDLSNAIFSFMRENGCEKNKISNGNLSRICDSTSKEIIKARSDDKIGFLDKCADLIDRFIIIITGNRKTNELVNEITGDLKINSKLKSQLNEIRSSINSLPKKEELQDIAINPSQESIVNNKSGSKVINDTTGINLR